MKTLLKLVYVVMIILTLVTAIWFMLVWTIGGSGTFIDDIMIAPVGNASVMDIAVYLTLGWFALVALIRTFKAVQWFLLFLINCAGVLAWYAMQQQSAWEDYVPFFFLLIIVVMMANVVLNLIRPMRVRLVH